MTAATKDQHLWMDKKRGHFMQRLRERRRRRKPERQREYRVRRANGQTGTGTWGMLPGRSR